MIKESVVFMMLLISASLVGTISVYEPVKVGTQPQAQQPPPQAQQPIQPQQLPPNTQILGQAKPLPGTEMVTSQLREDAATVDRLFPFIVRKLDGKTLAQKIDVATLVQKMDGRQLATLLQKVDGRTLAALLQKTDGQLLAQRALPYLDIRASVNSKYGDTSILNVNDVARDLGLTAPERRSSTVSCSDGETAVGGGFSYSSDPEDSYVNSVVPTSQNGWAAGAVLGDNGRIQAYVTCLTLNVGLRDANQPQTPPGGPPLQPPPGSSSGPIVR